MSQQQILDKKRMIYRTDETFSTLIFFSINLQEVTQFLFKKKSLRYETNDCNVVACLVDQETPNWEFDKKKSQLIKIRFSELISEHTTK